MLADVAEIHEAAAEARGQRLTTDLPERLEISGGRDLLLQAVANLLDNAIKFTPPGGEVRLSAAAAAGKRDPGRWTRRNGPTRRESRSTDCGMRRQVATYKLYAI